MKSLEEKCEALQPHHLCILSGTKCEYNIKENCKYYLRYVRKQFNGYEIIEVKKEVKQ